MFIVRGIYNFDFCFTYLCSFSGENIAVLGPATKLPLWAYDAATRSYLHPRISINIHPHVTRCAIMHFFTAYSPKWVFLCCIPTFFNFVCGRWFSRCEKENSKLPVTLTLKYIYSTSGLVDNGNRFNWFRTIQKLYRTMGNVNKFWACVNWVLKSFLPWSKGISYGWFNLKLACMLLGRCCVDYFFRILKIYIG